MKLAIESTLLGKAPNDAQLHRREKHRWEPLFLINSARSAEGIKKTLQSALHGCPSISVDPEVLEGQPRITGTRIPVTSVLRAVELYESIDGALLCYPHLERQQVKDALYYSRIVLERRSGFEELTSPLG